jgi:hypothetical protein
LNPKRLWSWVASTHTAVRRLGGSALAYNERMQLAARGLRLAPVPIRRLGLHSARRARLRNEPPAGVRWVHGGRQLMRKPLCGRHPLNLSRIG